MNRGLALQLSINSLTCAGAKNLAKSLYSKALHEPEQYGEGDLTVAWCLLHEVEPLDEYLLGVYNRIQALTPKG